MCSVKYIFTLFFFLNIGVISASDTLLTDSVMKNVMRSAEFYHGLIKSYEAEVYMRTNVNTKKKNFLYKYTNLIPNFVIYDTKNDTAIIESVSNLTFKSPNTYSQDLKYVNGTLTKHKDIALLPFRFISMDVYGESANGEIFYLPLREKTSQYYNYSISHVENEANRTIYTINFFPKNKNPQLISGSFMVENKTWRVLSFYAEGNDLLFEFSFDIKMEDSKNNLFLPEKFNITQEYRYLGNKVTNTFHAEIKYRNIKFQNILYQKKSFDLGNIFRMRFDSVPKINDKELWDKLRTIPLNDAETALIERHLEKERIAQIESAKRDSLKSQSDVTLQLMKNVVINTKYRFKSVDFRYSGLLNPSMIGYSTREGLSYRQKFALGIDLPREQKININLIGGYVFGIKQLTYGINTVWNYEPTKLGYLSFSAGRGNPTYSSRFLSLIKDSLINYNEPNLRTYKDYYFKLFNSVELVNGLQLGLGIDYHIREPNQYSAGKEMLNSASLNLPIQYTFVPMIRLIWTPAQYYIIDRNQKVYVRSNYPTFKIEYAQSFLNVLGGTSSYNRLEFDINQRIRFSLMNSLNYHFGGGFFTRVKNEYFNDFTYFAKYYFPETWGDGIGGSFNVLPYHYFNSSNHYVQAHLMYETPRFILTRISALSSALLRERIYLSQLYTPNLQSYTEFGYGFGNRFLNVAVFVGFHKLKYENITAKVAFLL